MAAGKRSKARAFRRLVVYGGIALVAAAGSLWAGGLFPRGEAAPEVQTAVAKRGAFQITIAASGAVQPYEEVNVGAQVSGQLETVHVTVGDQVAKSDLLAEIDPTLLKARVASARASLDGLRAQLAEQQANTVYARQLHQRNQRLYQGDATSKDTVQSSEAALKVAEARIAALEAQIRQSESSLGEVEANLNYTKIYAPISGTVVAQEAVEGQTLNVNQTAPTVLRIANLQTMTVWAEVSEADVMRLKLGMPVYFKTLGSGREWHSQLRQILPEPEILNDVVLFKALIDVDNGDGQLLPDMTTQVFFVEGKVDDAVLVPMAALMDLPEKEGGRRGDRAGSQPDRPANPSSAASSERPMRVQTAAAGPNGELNGEPRGKADGPGTPAMVVVMNNGQEELRLVHVGLKGRNQAEILSGLQEGDVVALQLGGATAAGERGQNRPSRGFRL